jgi:RNA polymerase sigma-70 factor (ECF subfamily)
MLEALPCYRARRLDDAAYDELVRQIAEGGTGAPRAELALCQRFAPRVRAYGLRHLHDAERARDFVQVVLMAVLEAARAGRIEDPARLDRFILGTCRNTALRTREQSIRSQPLSDELLAVLGSEPREFVDTRALFACFEVLEVRAKQVMMLTFVEDKSADEVAAALTITAGNVRVLRHRALAALRQCLDRGAGAAS